MMRRALVLICGVFLAAAYMRPAVAVDFDFSAPRGVSDPALAATMRDLAERVLPVYQEPDPERYLATLSALQMVAGSYAAADVSRQSLRERGPEPQAQRSMDRAVIFDIYDDAKARQARERISFADSFAKSFHVLVPPLSDLQAYRLSPWLKASAADFGRALQVDLDRLRQKNSISEADATQLIWNYLSFEAYREFAPLIAALDAEDHGRRYAELEVMITTPHEGHVAARIVRPRSTEQPLPALLNFALEPSSSRASDFAEESAAHGYVGIVAHARSAAQRPVGKAALELDGDDARAVVEWLAAQSWSDRRVGMYGEGVGGFVVWAAAQRGTNALRAIATSGASAPGIDFPMEGNIPLNSGFAWALQNSKPQASPAAVLGPALDQRWYRSGRRYRDLGRLAGTPNRTFIRWLNHPSYDRYWQKLIPYRQQFAAISLPVLTITGFYAASEPAAVYYFRQHTRYDPNADHTLVIGPYDDAALRDNPGSVVQRLPLDPSAFLDLRDLRYQWFDHVFKGTPPPALLSDQVNYQVGGGDEWRHSPSLAAMENAKQRFYLGSVVSRDGHHELRDGSSDKTFTEQSISVADRHDADSAAVSALLMQAPELRNGVVFESAPFKHTTDVTGAFSGHLDFTINKRDVDLAMTLYEHSAGGAYIRLLSPAYQFRASYARDRAHRRLMKAGKRQGLDFQSERLIGRRLQAGSRLVLVLSVQKRPDQEINYGTGGDVSEESLADGRRALKIRWHADSYVDLPIRR
jgi:putative CocE/NonD family hydrolase